MKVFRDIIDTTARAQTTSFGSQCGGARTSVLQTLLAGRACRRADSDTARMAAQLLADAQRVLRSFAGGSAVQLAEGLAQRSLAQQVAHRLLELKARWRHTRRKQAGSALGQLALRRLA